MAHISRLKFCFWHKDSSFSAKSAVVFCGDFLFIHLFSVHRKKEKQMHDLVWRQPPKKKQLMLLFPSEFQCCRISWWTKMHY